jgi:hypothetical protein
MKEGAKISKIWGSPTESYPKYCSKRFISLTGSITEGR